MNDNTELYLGNLPFDVGAAELHQSLTNLGCPAKQIRVSTRPGTKGKARLTFYTAEDSLNAHRLLNGMSLGGRRLFVKEWPAGGWEQLKQEFLQAARR